MFWLFGELLEGVRWIAVDVDDGGGGGDDGAVVAGAAALAFALAVYCSMVACAPTGAEPHRQSSQPVQSISRHSTVQIDCPLSRTSHFPLGQLP